jgi:hypothetical protein
MTAAENGYILIFYSIEGYTREKLKHTLPFSSSNGQLFDQHTSFRQQVDLLASGHLSLSKTVTHIKYNIL